MKVISKFHDYYDTAMGAGYDDRLVFVRKTEETVNFKTLSTWYDKPRGRRLWYEKPYWHSPLGSVLVVEGVVGFCGKLYPVVRISWPNSEYESPTGHYRSTFCYTVEQCKKAHQRVAEEARPECLPNDSSLSWFKNQMAFLERGPTADDTTFVKYQTPIFFSRLLRGALFDSSLVKSEPLLINPCLKKVDFQRCVDPYTAYQEIEMYLGGVLGSEGSPMAEVDDEHRYSGHGFDKESFRRPAGVKPNRKRKKKNT